MTATANEALLPWCGDHLGLRQELLDRRALTHAGAFLHGGGRAAGQRAAGGLGRVAPFLHRPDQPGQRGVPRADGAGER